MKAKLIGGLLVLAGGGTLLVASDRLDGFLGGWEGEGQNRVYADKLARGLPTVCKGLTRHITDTPIVVGEIWPEAKCEGEERKALTKVQLQLIECFDQDPPQSVFDAATSHAWNVGVLSTCQSGAMRAWQAELWQLGCQRIYMQDTGRPAWSYVKTGRRLANGMPEYKFVQGLANRRRAEYDLCVEDLQ
jgi:lysozyme